MSVQIYQGDCREQMHHIDPSTVDSVVTDPPYGLSFMGNAWDYDVPDVEVWKQCFRVLKPGGYLLAFFGSRTYHRGVIPIEDAGFEIRDQMMWLYGSGFPKSHNVSLAIDKMKGAEREVVGVKGQLSASGSGIYGYNKPRAELYEGGWTDTYDVTEPATDEAKQWNGWGTCLKPGHEPIVLARKPFDGTVAKNVLDHGTGAINIDGCRYNDGKFPANVMHDGLHEEWAEYFYCPKANKHDRNEGLDDLDDKQLPGVDGDSYMGMTSDGRKQTAKNIHPTVKPNELMRYLCRLVTPPGGIVLDPFTGSGSTGKAASMEGFSFIGCELNPEYVEIARARATYELPQRSIF